MTELAKPSRREFLQTTMTGAAALPLLGALSAGDASAEIPGGRSQVFRVNGCPVHDGQLRHVGVDALLHLLSTNGTKFYKSDRQDALSGPSGLIAASDVVVLKVNAQWKCRGCTNTDMLRGLIHRILGHPDGFKGEVVIFENGQGRPAAFDGVHSDSDKPEYKPFPELIGKVMVNAEQQDVTTIDYLVNHVFAGKPVSAFLMDPFANVWIAADDHKTNGYRRIGQPGAPCISYPCFTTARGHRIELKEGVWTGSHYAQNLKLIHLAVLKDHSGDIGMTGALKIVYGTLSMSDGTSAKRHYQDLGSQCARMWTEVRPTGPQHSRLHLGQPRLDDGRWAICQRLHRLSAQHHQPPEHFAGRARSAGHRLSRQQTHTAAAGRNSAASQIPTTIRDSPAFTSRLRLRSIAPAVYAGTSSHRRRKHPHRLRGRAR